MLFITVQTPLTNKINKTIQRRIYEFSSIN